MIRDVQLRLLPKEAASEQALADTIARECAIDRHAIRAVRVTRRSIDARQRTIYINVRATVFINEEPSELAYTPTSYGDVSNAPRVVIVGAGPAGLFAALRLIEHGLCPIVLERGKDVHSRKRDIALIQRNHATFDQANNPNNPTTQQPNHTESNYSFGEGGAGAFSDGKLYTRSTKRGNVNKILNVLCQHGASTAILADAHPHIGTDRLPLVIENIRKTILASGGELHFQTRMTQLLMQGDTCVGCSALTTNERGEQTEQEYRGPVILATGHSARDVYRYLASAKVEIEAKALAMGVRLEHPAQLIDQLQYHNRQGRGPYLPAAEYSFVTQVDGRGVYSFCMCPGGFVIPAATGAQQMVVNGMSPANRGTQWSNSGMVVEIPLGTGLVGQADSNNPLHMLEQQEKLERLTWQQSDGTLRAPAQRMADFVNGRLSCDLPRSSYSPGLIASPLHFWMPEPIAKRLQQAFRTFGKQCHGFLTNDAVVIASETRTSAPLRILRDSHTLQHIRLQGLYPCGEGAGYAGGIVSAAIDGERCADAIASGGGGLRIL